MIASRRRLHNHNISTSSPHASTLNNLDIDAANSHSSFSATSRSFTSTSTPAETLAPSASTSTFFQFAGRPRTHTLFPPTPDDPSPAKTFSVRRLDPQEYMSAAYDFSNPAIRIQHSSPAHQSPFDFPADSAAVGNWLYNQQQQTPGGNGSGSSSSVMANSAMQQALSQSNRHRRIPSSSSAGSASPASPYSQPLSNHHTQSYSNHLPTPTQTPTQDSFMSSSSSTQPPFTTVSYDNMNGHSSNPLAAHLAMKSVFGDSGSVGGDEAPGFSPARQSVSSYGRNSPATPRTISGDDFNDDFRVPPNDSMARPNGTVVPKFDRSNTDIYADTGFDPTSQPTSMPSQRSSSKANQLLSPFHASVMEQRLAQANQARSMSPSLNGSSRGVSPFREGSRYAHMSSASNNTRLPIHAPRGNPQVQSNVMVQRGGHQQEAEPKTISPKDAVLEYNETEEDPSSKMSLFPDSSTFNPYLQQQQQAQNPSNGRFATSFGPRGNVNPAMNVNGWSAQHGASAFAQQSPVTTPAATSAPLTSAFNFAPSSVPGMFHAGGAFVPTSMPSEETPEFPASLLRMDSSASEAPPQSSAASTNYTSAPHDTSSSASINRPMSTLADTGTYTCTYHGCTQRFETPQKLQRHKRDAHRSQSSGATASSAGAALSTPSPVMPGIGSGMSSAALAARNSQAGPHKCERINPTTGKPCNTIFSRPYDLTRHEDTIHNARKQKVRCALCQEEKTFSRNDALTRHMRVVHPDVDFPGKHRRRGGRDD